MREICEAATSAPKAYVDLTARRWKRTYRLSRPQRPGNTANRTRRDPRPHQTPGVTAAAACTRRGPAAALPGSAGRAEVRWVGGGSDAEDGCLWVMRGRVVSGGAGGDRAGGPRTEEKRRRATTSG